MTTFAASLQTSFWRRQLLFLLATLGLLTCLGYYYGTFDHTLLLPFMFKRANPALFPTDPFFALDGQHQTFLWFFFIPFYQAGHLPEALFVTFLIVTYLAFWAIWDLAQTLFDQPLASLLAVLLLSLPHLSFAGFPLLEFSLINRVFVLPFLLWAVTLYLRGRVVPAFALLGVLYNLHVISVNFVLGMLLFDGLLRFRQVGLRRLGTGLLGFLALAMPVLAWRARSGAGLDLSLNGAWLDMVARGAMMHMYYAFAPHFHILLATLSGCGTLLIYALARRASPAGRHDRPVGNFVLAILLALGVAIVTTYLLPVTILLQLQIIRAGVYLLVFAYLYFARWLAVLWQSGRLRRADFAALAMAGGLSPFPITVPLVWGAYRALARIPRRAVITLALAALLFGLSALVGLRYGLWQPGVYPYGPPSAWRDVGLWARTNTPLEAVFIAPPYLFDTYEAGWRVFSERATVAELGDLVDIAYSPDYLEVWQPRFEAIAPGALAEFNGDFFANREITARAFYSLSSVSLLAVARAYGATYLVVEKSHTHPFPVAYQNTEYTVYDLQPVLAAEIAP